MTREEAIMELKRFSGTTQLRLSANFCEALNTAIKALEQDSVLDKIRAEIAECGSIRVTFAITDETKTDKGIEKLARDILARAKEQTLDIIDKYKAESEE